jgi:RNA recognition motif-containing protein
VSIFVGNLPFRAEQEDVIELFAPYGEVVNCSLPLERDTGRKRGFAFVEMADPAMEERAIEALQGAEMMGRPLRINKAEPRGGGGGGGGGFQRRAGAGHRAVDSDHSRPSGARGWEDRSYGGGSSWAEEGGFEAGRTRRRRGGAGPVDRSGGMETEEPPGAEG